MGSPVRWCGGCVWCRGLPKQKSVEVVDAAWVRSEMNRRVNVAAELMFIPKDAAALLLRVVSACRYDPQHLFR